MNVALPILPLSDLRYKAKQVLQQVKERPVILTQRSRPQAVLIDYETYNDMAGRQQALEDARDAFLLPRAKETARNYRPFSALVEAIQTRVWPPEQGQWTYEDWLCLPDDGFRYEVLGGVLYMTPPPAVLHQIVIVNLTTALRNFVRERGLGLVLPSPCGVRLPGELVPVQPDILFVQAERRNIIGEDYVEGAPDLVVEVLSPSNWMYDRREKFLTYQQAGVPEYWIVDYRAGTIEVFVLEKGEYLLTNEFRKGDTAISQVLAGFSVAVDEVLAE